MKNPAMHRLRFGGFGLIELMVALALGLIVSAGVVVLFQSVSKTTRVQASLSRIQEHGRFAMTRLASDVRQTSGQYCSRSEGLPLATSNGPVRQARAPWIYTTTLGWADAPAETAASAPYRLSPRFFVQGYECSSGSCAPGSIPSGIPAVGTAPNARLKGTDVLTVRFLQNGGWPVSAVSAACASGSTVTLAPQPGDRPVSIAAGRRVMISDCRSPVVLPSASTAGNVVTLGTVLAGTPLPSCGSDPTRDVRLFDFDADFATVSYFIKLTSDPNPDEPARTVPVLVRRAGGVDQELVRGVDRLDFVYGVQDRNGAVRYLTAEQVTAQSSAATCVDPPSGVTLEAGCLWRSLVGVETHLLLTTVDNVYDLSPTEQAFVYAPDGASAVVPATGASSPVTGLAYGRMMRREFIGQTNVRNANP